MLKLPGRCTGCRRQWASSSTPLDRGVKTVHLRRALKPVCCAPALRKPASHRKKVKHGGRCGNQHCNFAAVCRCPGSSGITGFEPGIAACWFRHCHSSIAFWTAVYLWETIPAR
jgi:hypothetical protein